MIDYYKVVINIDTTINNKLICLFINDRDERTKTNIIFNKNPEKTKIENKDYLKKMLTDIEYASIGNTVNICISDYPLFQDDTVEEFKIKLFFTLKKYKILINTDSLYIYSNSYSTSSLNIDKKTDRADYLYRLLSKNKKNLITWDVLCEFLLNCGTRGLEIIQQIDRKMYYFYEDLSLYNNLFDQIDVFYTPVSHYLTTIRNRLSFVHNPEMLVNFFNGLFKDEPKFYEKEFIHSSIQTKFLDVSNLLIDNTNELLSTNNGKVLYDFTIDDTTLYVVQPFNIDDALINSFNSIKNTVLSKNIIALFTSFYFPKIKPIYNNGILNKDDYDKIIKNQNFVKNEKKYAGYFNKIGSVYSLDDAIVRKKNKFVYITQLMGTYYQEFPFLFPCESIFKKLKTNQLMPFSKYNPGKNQENINRLYVSGLSQKGSKIPLLTKTLIQKLNSKNGIQENIMYYFTIGKTLFEDYKKKTNKYTGEIIDQLVDKIPVGNYEIKLVFNNDSSVSYRFNCSDMMGSIEIAQIQHLIKTCCEPVLLFIQNELLTMGPRFKIMSSFNETNFELHDIHLDMVFENIKITDLDFDKYAQCSSNLITKQEILKKATSENRLSFMYKRISNYTKLNAIESSIIQFINVGYGEPSIVRFLVSNYGIDELEAKQAFLNVLSQINVERSINPNRHLRIKNNPGLNFDFVDVPFTNNMIIEITNINSFELLNNILDKSRKIVTLLSSQFSKDDKTDIIKVCKKPAKIEEFELHNEINDTNAIVEQPINSNEPSENLIKNLLDAKMNAQAITFDEDDDDVLQTKETFDEAMDDDLMELLLSENDIEGLEELDVDSDEQKQEESPEELPEESADELDMLGGNGKNIEGMSLTNPNPFFDKMYSLDPKLFIKKKTGQFNAYSRMCPWNVKRQPIILTKEEIDKIDKEHPGSYNKSIKYGSSEDKQFYYICPRYWCLKENVSLTEEEVKAGACGGVDAIIPKNAKKVPPGKHIFEFYADSEHKEKDGSYTPHYPGFLSGDKHPDGLCVPCCFKAWDSNLQKKRRKECTSANEKTNDVEQDKSDSDDKSRKQTEQDDGYIIGVDKFPLPSDRWGMLPVEIQTFLNINNNDCFADVETHKLKQNVKCILRQGIELSQRKSFIGALANVYASFSNTERILSIKSMCKHISKSITLDHFVEAQNGSLVSMFFTSQFFGKIDQKKIDTVKDTKLYQLTDFNNLSQQIYFKRALSSFIKFKKYLNNENSYIDHEILWDLVCMPNPNLFGKGINLVILNIPDDDMTNNVEIICPSNKYSSMFYNSRKFTFILIKKNDFYEPIYTYEETDKTINIQKLFNEFTPRLLPKLKEFIQTIKEFLNECHTKQNPEYAKVFEKGNTVDTIIRLINKAKGVVKNYVVNSSMKIVGIICDFERNEKTFKNIYIPSIPSSLKISKLSKKEELLLITYDELEGNTLKNTINGLNAFHSLSLKVNTKPYSLVDEDTIIVGVITNTNQFVPINQPLEITNPLVEKLKTKMPVITSYDEREINKRLATHMGLESDKRRVNNSYDKYKLSMLEQTSFQRFRNKIKVLLQTPKFHQERKNISKTIQSNDDYLTKMMKIVKMIKKLVKTSITFYTVEKFNEYRSTIETKKKHNYYYIEDLKTLILPKNNLTNPSIDNSIFYVEKISDELIRFSRIYDFLLNNQYNTGYINIDYNLRENELLIPSSELDGSFFDDIVDVSKYYDIIYSLDFYNAKPQTKQKISNSVLKEKKTKIRKLNIKKNIRKPKTDEPNEKPTSVNTGEKPICNITKSNTLRAKWKTLLGSKFKSNVYDASIECSYQVVCNIINIFMKHKESDFITPVMLRRTLNSLYKSLTTAHKKEVLSMLSHDGKIEFSRKIKTNTILLENLPLMKEYYLSLPDILLLSNYYKLPLIIVTSGKMKSINTNIAFTKSLQLEEKDGEIKIPKEMSFFILKLSGVTRNEPFIYELFLDVDDNIQLNISMFKKKFKDYLKETTSKLGNYKYTLLDTLIY